MQGYAGRPTFTRESSCGSQAGGRICQPPGGNASVRLDWDYGQGKSGAGRNCGSHTQSESTRGSGGYYEAASSRSSGPTSTSSARECSSRGGGAATTELQGRRPSSSSSSGVVVGRGGMVAQPGCTPRAGLPPWGATASFNDWDSSALGRGHRSSIESGVPSSPARAAGQRPPAASSRAASSSAVRDAPQRRGSCESSGFYNDYRSEYPSEYRSDAHQQSEYSENEASWVPAGGWGRSSPQGSEPSTPGRGGGDRVAAPLGGGPSWPLGRRGPQAEEAMAFSPPARSSAASQARSPKHQHQPATPGTPATPVSGAGARRASSAGSTCRRAPVHPSALGGGAGQRGNPRATEAARFYQDSTQRVGRQASVGTPGARESPLGASGGRHPGGAAERGAGGSSRPGGIPEASSSVLFEHPRGERDGGGVLEPGFFSNPMRGTSRVTESCCARSVAPAPSVADSMPLGVEWCTWNPYTSSHMAKANSGR